MQGVRPTLFYLLYAGFDISNVLKSNFKTLFFFWGGRGKVDSVFFKFFPDVFTGVRYTVSSTNRRLVSVSTVSGSCLSLVRQPVYLRP